MNKLFIVSLICLYSSLKGMEENIGTQAELSDHLYEDELSQEQYEYIDNAYILKSPSPTGSCDSPSDLLVPSFKYYRPLKKGEQSNDSLRSSMKIKKVALLELYGYIEGLSQEEKDKEKESLKYLHPDHTQLPLYNCMLWDLIKETLIHRKMRALKLGAEDQIDAVELTKIDDQVKQYYSEQIESLHKRSAAYKEIHEKHNKRAKKSDD